MSHFHHKGVLLVNLGTPAAPTPRDVRVYLREFLSDARVVDLPRWLWLPLLNLVILPIRGRRSASAYAKVWSQEGSPLMVNSEAITHALGEALEGKAMVRLAMRYGQPSVKSVMAQMQAAGVDELVVLPLYPQYSHTTTGTVCDAVDETLVDLDWQPTLKRICDYHVEPAWVRAVAGSIRRFQAEHGSGEKLLFSMHGIPERYARQGDPYPEHCKAGAKAIADELGLADEEWLMTYQSRFGREPWLQPYTDKTLEALAEDEVGHVQVVCPGFAADCLETLEEIAMENRAGFIEAGGERLDYIPALNDDPGHIAALAEMVGNELAVSRPGKCNRRCRSPGLKPR